MEIKLNTFEYKKELNDIQFAKLRKIANYMDIYMDNRERVLSRIFSEYDKDYFNKILMNDEIMLRKVMTDFINIFNEFKELPILICIHGSFARRTNLLYSDVDITMLYEDKLKDVFLPI